MKTYKVFCTLVGIGIILIALGGWMHIMMHLASTGRKYQMLAVLFVPIAVLIYSGLFSHAVKEKDSEV